MAETPRQYGAPGGAEAEPSAQLPPLPVELNQAPSVKPDESSDIPTCPLLDAPCILDACAWFNDMTGYCWVPEMALCIKRGRWR